MRSRSSIFARRGAEHRNGAGIADGAAARARRLGRTLLREVFADLAPADPGPGHAGGRAGGRHRVPTATTPGCCARGCTSASRPARSGAHARRAGVRAVRSRPIWRARWACVPAPAASPPAIPTRRGLRAVRSAAGQSVLIAPTAAPDPAAEHGAMGFVDFAQALLLQSHVLAPLHPAFACDRALPDAGRAERDRVVPRPVRWPRTPCRPVAGRRADGPRGLGARPHRLVDSPRYGGRIRLLHRRGCVLPRFRAGRAGCPQSVDIRMYIFDRDAYAVRIADLLKTRSRGDSRARAPRRARFHRCRGRRVANSLSVLDRRAAKPVSAAGYLRERANIPRCGRCPNPFLTSDHTKVLLIDSERAFVGGMNIGHQYRYVWHDLDWSAQRSSAILPSRWCAQRTPDTTATPQAEVPIEHDFSPPHSLGPPPMCLLDGTPGSASRRHVAREVCEPAPPTRRAGPAMVERRQSY